MLVEKNMLIQAKDATINEKVKQIKVLRGEGPYSFKSVLFFGIFDGLSKQLGRNLADSSDVDVTASSVFNDSYDPKNVLKKMIVTGKAKTPPIHGYNLI